MWRRHHLGLTPTPLGESAGAVSGPVGLWSLTNASSGHRVTGAARLGDAGAQRAGRTLSRCAEEAGVCRSSVAAVQNRPKEAPRLSVLVPWRRKSAMIIVRRSEQEIAAARTAAASSAT